MAGLPKILFATLLLIFIGRQVESDASNHRYNKGDMVPFYANIVGPFANPRLVKSHIFSKYLLGKVTCIYLRDSQFKM